MDRADGTATSQGLATGILGRPAGNDHGDRPARSLFYFDVCRDGPPPSGPNRPRIVPSGPPNTASRLARQLRP